METLRTFFRQHNALAFALIAIALCLKIIVPSGYMVAQDTRTIVNWDVAARDWNLLKTRTREQWDKIASK